jgi:phosphohistidine phosphatase
MELVLWRHADAEMQNPKGDAERALTSRGREQAERQADWLRARVDPRWRVLVSPAVRALQTVAPLGVPFEVEPRVGLSATARSVLEAAGWPDAEAPVLVVGHNPTLAEVVERLLGRDLDVRKGAVIWLATTAAETSLTAVQEA